MGDRNRSPLPALTAEHAVGQLIHRVVGPAGQDLAPVLEWARGGDPEVITARHQLPPTALGRRLQLVRAEGARTPLRQAVVDELSAPGAHSEMHRRARRLFGLPTPPRDLPMRVSRSTGVALRVLATLGPLPIEVLCER